jgi:2-polyprenyl-3-methyl-5-hydroxy-6-metoxy-1,4-benzoquinol methylase/ribosomal protein S27E
MKKITKCNICGKTLFESLFYEKDKLHKIRGKFGVVKCLSCGLIFINPQPSFKELKKYYPKKYYSFDKIRTLSKDKNVRLKLFLYRLYYDKNNHRPFLRAIFYPIKYLIRTTEVSSKYKILDVGCGSGQFLYEMKKLGIKELHGVEPGGFDQKSAIKYGLKIKKTDLLAENYPNSYFDLITMSHVLEHTNNPSQIIKETKRILKQKGKLIISVPNSRSLNFFLFRKNWFNLDVPRHLFTFNDINLPNLLRKNGFKIIKLNYLGNFIDIGSIEYVLNNFGYKKGKIGKKFFDLVSLTGFLIFDRILSLLKIGDKIEIISEKI